MIGKIELWKIYTYIGSLIANKSRTGNIVGEFTEELLTDFYSGKQAPPSTKGYDFEANGIRYQVKSRVANTRNKITGNLSDIHSWNFDILIVVFYENNGNIKLVKEFNVADAQAMASYNKYRSIISTSNIYNNTSCKDITQKVKAKYGL